MASQLLGKKKTTINTMGRLLRGSVMLSCEVWNQKLGISVVRSADNSRGDVSSGEKDLRATQHNFNLLKTEPKAQLRHCQSSLWCATADPFCISTHGRPLVQSPPNCCVIPLVLPQDFAGHDSNRDGLRPPWAYLAADLSLSREDTFDPVSESTTNKSTAASQEKVAVLHSKSVRRLPTKRGQLLQ